MDDYFNPRNFDYKSYMLEMYGLVKEMPEILPPREPMLNDYITNSGEATQIEKSYKPIGNFDFVGKQLRIFHFDEEDMDFYYLLDEKEPYILGVHQFRRLTTPIECIENLDIWNCKRFGTGLIRMWFKNQIIPNEKRIISDKILSKKGLGFWMGLFRDYRNTHKMYIFDMKTSNKVKEISDQNELVEFWKSNTYHLRFLLEKL